MANDTRHAHRRSRYLRAFMQWHQAVKTRLPVQLIRAHRADPRRRDSLLYLFEGLPAALQVCVRNNEIGISVTHQGECWDFLVFFESQARRVADAGQDGYRCHQCIGHGKTWPTRQALWIEHDFETFLSWLREHLLTAQALELHRVDGGSWAALMPADESPTTAPVTTPATLVQRWPLTFPRL